jgi:hypothetical protein
VGLLPPWARRIYGLPGVPTTDPVASVSARAIRLALRAIPEKVFHGPIYNAAMERAAVADGAPRLIRESTPPHSMAAFRARRGRPGTSFGSHKPNRAHRAQ